MRICDEPSNEDQRQSSLKDILYEPYTRNSSKVHPENFSKSMLSQLTSPLDTVPLYKGPIRRATSIQKQLSLISNMNSSEQKIRIMYCIVFLIIDLIFNLLSVINLIIMTYYRLHYLDESFVDACFAIEILMLIFFMVETVNILRHGIKKGWNYWIYIKLGCNILLIFQILWMFMHPPFLSDLQDGTILINIIRAFRIFCINNFMMGLKKTISDEDRETESQKDEIPYFVLKHFMTLFSAIFIEATLFISMDDVCDLKGFSKNNPYDLEYISALYYSIVTLTTIGYGDINVANFYTRTMMICILFINLSVVSIFIGRVGELVYQISPYVKDYDFKNHVIIMGELPLSFLRYFLLELQEIDKIQNNLFNLSIKRSKIQNILIVDNKKPSVEIEYLLADPGFSFEINYLMDNMSNKKWYSLSNLKHAKHLFLFSINYSETEYLNGIRDLSLIAMAKRIETDLKIPMTLVLSTDTSENFQTNFSSNVTIISHNLLNNQILGNSLENPGFNTWLTHLMTLREKNVRFISDSSAAESNFFRLYEYAQSMSQEIYPISKVFNGCLFIMKFLLGFHSY